MLGSIVTSALYERQVGADRLVGPRQPSLSVWLLSLVNDKWQKRTDPSEPPSLFTCKQPHLLGNKGAGKRQAQPKCKRGVKLFLNRTFFCVLQEAYDVL